MAVTTMTTDDFDDDDAEDDDTGDDTGVPCRDGQGLLEQVSGAADGGSEGHDGRWTGLHFFRYRRAGS